MLRVLTGVCELFGEKIHNMFGGCCCYFVVELIWKCLMWVVVLCWIDRVQSSKECEHCACDSSVHLSVPSIGFVMILYVGSYLLIYVCERWITGVALLCFFV